ncbi:MAG: HEAT repeat domain-containing protein [Verrucomicrobiia bacterium]
MSTTTPGVAPASLPAMLNVRATNAAGKDAGATCLRVLCVFALSFVLCGKFATAADLSPLLGPQEQLGLDAALRANMMGRADLSYRKDNAETEFRLEKVRRFLHESLALPPHADAVARELRATDSLAKLAGFLACEREIRFTPPPRSPGIAGDPVSYLVAACERANALITKAFAAVPAEERLQAAALYAVEELHQSPELLKKVGADKLDYEAAHLAMLAPHRKIDCAALAEAFQILCAAIDDALPLLKAHPPAPMTRDTPLGKVVVGTTGNDVYRDDALLIIDPGGDDVYLNSAGGADGLAGRPISVVIDLADNDRYEGRRSFSQGCGFWGIGILADCSGDDTYVAQNCTQGAALFGCGMLADFGGHDRYEADTMAQGAATFGLAALWDRAGDDGYRAAQFAQAVAGVGGCGVLLEGEGNDTYYVGGKYGDNERYSARFLSLGQGFAIGARPFAAGGVAILCDLAGNDNYYADIYGQGVSYWYSLGMLLDLGGNDTYRIYHYGQGAGIHLSPAILADWSGDDNYSSHGLCQGSAHDYGVGILIDKAGNDHYTADEIAQGSAVYNATGIFIDSAGDDLYAGRDAKQCQAAGHDGVRREYGAVGLFCDLGGHDAYVGGGRDNFVWLKPLYGAGVDTEITNAVWTVNPKSKIQNPKLEMPEALEPRYGPTPWHAPRDDAERELSALYEKTVSYGDSGERLAQKQKAVEEIRKRGAAVLPFLIRQLDRREPMARQRIEDWICDWGAASIPALLDGLAVDDLDIRRNCIFFLRQWPDERVAPAVMKFLDNERLQPTCLHTLGKQNAAAALGDAMRLLGSPKELVRMRAAQALGRIGSVVAVPKLVGALGDRLWDVRRQAEGALVAIGKPSVQPLLEAATQHSKSQIQNLSVLHAIESLGRLQVQLPAELLTSDDWAARGFAAATLTDAGRLRAMRKAEKNPFVLSRIDETLEKVEREPHEDRLRR